MRNFFFIGTIGFISILSLSTRADHSHEGSVAMSELTEEAERNNLELKQAQENLQALQFKKSSLRGAFTPQLSVDGSVQNAQFDDERNKATSLYGKAEWNLYNGGADQIAYELQNNEILIQEKRLRSLKSKTKAEVSKIYYELQFILESLSLKERALQLNAQQMKIAKSKNSSGFTTNSDVLEFDLRESTLKSDLILLNQQLEKKSRELDVILSRPSQNQSLAVRGHLTRDLSSFDRNELLKKIQNQNEQILKSQQEVQEAEYEWQQARSQFLPKLNLEGRYGRLASEEKGFKENNNFFVILKMSWNLFSGFKDSYATKSANSKRIAQQLDLQQKNIALTAELDSILAEIKALNIRLDLEEKNLERSEKYYKLTLDEYRRGVKNSPDMVGASERLLETRIRNLEYRRDLMLAKAKVQEMIGE